MADALELLIQGGGMGIGIIALGILSVFMRFVMTTMNATLKELTDAVHGLREAQVRHVAAIENNTATLKELKTETHDHALREG